MTVDLTEHRS